MDFEPRLIASFAHLGRTVEPENNRCPTSAPHKTVRGCNIKLVCNAAANSYVLSYRQRLKTAPDREELSPNFGDGRSRSGGGGCGLTVGRLGDDLDPVVECHTKNEFWQLVGAVETAPAFLRGFQQFEDHRERGPVGQAALRSDRAVAHGGEGARSRPMLRLSICWTD